MNKEKFTLDRTIGEKKKVNEWCWDEIKERLALFLWGKTTSGDAHKLAETIMPFIKNEYERFLCDLQATKPIK